MRDGVREQLKSKRTISPSTSHSKMLGSRDRVSGWAAFDLKQQEKQGLKPMFDLDPYPPVQSNLTSMLQFKGVVNGRSPSAKSFSSVVQSSIGSPNLMDNDHDFKGKIKVSGSSTKLDTEVFRNVEKLKELHNWADVCLIEDILRATDNDFSQASTVMQSMFASGNSKQTMTSYLAEKGSSLEDFTLKEQNEQADSGVSLEKMTDFREMSFVLEKCLHEQNTKDTFKDSSTKTDLLSDVTAHVNLVSGQLITAPIEPEWQEDDVYLSLRKDAIRITRSAVQHSRAANNAFLRGDHCSARKLSEKAQEEWIAAEKLNSKAAQEILCVRNSKNDVWKLDLHGLHASEAVDALKEHLWKIETQMPLNRSLHPSRTVKPDSPVNSLSCFNMDIKTDKEKGICSQRHGVLQVITGTGNHSRGGQAAIPAAVRSFLVGSGYRFDDTRAGIIAVRPKFRDSHKT